MARFDGDLVMLTDNNVLVNKLVEHPAIMCEQKNAEKRVSTEEDFIKSNIDSFGNDIGQTTNWITSMYEIRERYSHDSKEYNELTQRIQFGQKYQQDAIDRTKGIICHPMPRYWHDRHDVNKIEDVEDREFQRGIVADKKPYYMRYIYPTLSKEVTTFEKNTKKNSLRLFQKTVEELKDMPASELTEEESTFVRHYDAKMPVGVSDCVMNRVCRKFEDEFDGYVSRHNSDHEFDYRIMRGDNGYTKSQYYATRKLYEEYTNRLKSYVVMAKIEHIGCLELSAEISSLDEEFIRECSQVCSNESTLCDIILDICYTKNSTKKFAWGVCSHMILENLMERNGRVISYPVMDSEGDISYGGNNYSLHSKKLEAE